MTYWIYWIKYIILLKLILFYIFHVGSGNFQVTCMAQLLFLWDSAALTLIPPSLLQGDILTSLTPQMPPMTCSHGLRSPRRHHSYLCSAWLTSAPSGDLLHEREDHLCSLTLHT